MSSFLSSAIIKKIGIYTAFFLGSLGHFAYVFASILPAYSYDYPERNQFFDSTATIITILMIGAILNGIGAGILWCAFGVYTSECATPSNKGFFFGLFWFIYMSS